jgi:hypothetical protein
MDRMLRIRIRIRNTDTYSFSVQVFNSMWLPEPHKASIRRVVSPRTIETSPVLTTWSRAFPCKPLVSPDQLDISSCPIAICRRPVSWSWPITTRLRRLLVSWSWPIAIRLWLVSWDCPTSILRPQRLWVQDLCHTTTRRRNRNRLRNYCAFGFRISPAIPIKFSLF